MRKTKSQVDEEYVTHCVYCNAIDDPDNGIRLRLETHDDGLNQVVCNICVPEVDQ